MPDIPTQLLTEILKRLPVKPLVRFKLVSKSWKSIINDPHFINLHLKHSIQTQTNHTLITRTSNLYTIDFPTLTQAKKLDHPLKNPSDGVAFLGSCNGLLCLSNIDDFEYKGGGDDDLGIIIFNPSTKMHKKLPFTRMEYPDTDDEEDGVLLVCNRWVYGFGYDHVHDDYKLVRIIQIDGISPDFCMTEVKVYSLKSHSWTRVLEFPRDYFMTHRRACGVHLNGCLHWVVTRKPGSDGSKLIVGFDLGSSRLKVIPQPGYSLSGYVELHLNVGVLRGCLYVMCNYAGFQTHVWVMKEYGVEESWTLEFIVAQPEVVGYFRFVRPLAYSKDGSKVLLQKDLKYLFWFDLQTQRAKRVNVRGMPDRLEVEMMVESLVPVDNQRKRKKKPRKKRNEKSGESSKFATLPMALLYNVLSRLPAKSLLQLRCVCKALNNLVRDPVFAKVHFEVSGKNNDDLNLIIREEELHFIDLNLLNRTVQMKPLAYHEAWTDVLGSCNGLLCLSNQDNGAALWNPLTGKQHILSVPDTKVRPPMDSDVFRSFIYGFGYDSVSDDYKVVRILQLHYYCGYDSDGILDPESDTFAGSEVQVYNLKNKKWRRIQCFPYILCYPCSGVLASGALHWVARRSRELDSTSYIIMAFDLSSEKCREVPQPNYDDINFHLSLAILGGSLCILCHYPKHGVDIWVMQDYGMISWRKLISIAQPKSIKFFEYIKPLVYSKNGNEVLMVLDYGKLIWYNLQKKTIRHVSMCGLPKSFGTEVFSGSLLDPDNIDSLSEIEQRKPTGADNLSSMNLSKHSILKQKQQTEQSSISLATLPEKLICHIFYQLPVKNLLQVQHVCKTWYSLVNRPEFIKMHLEVASKCKRGLSLIHGGKKVFYIDFERFDKAIEIKHPLLCEGGLTDIAGSSNGLVCLCKDKDVALWNPSTGKYETLPPAVFEFSHASYAVQCFIHGFGYDPTSDDYKVVCVRQLHNRLKGGGVHSEVQVYSMKSERWRCIQHFPYTICYPCAGFFASGALHWVARQSPELYSSSNVLLAFNLVSEKCKVMMQPNYVDTDFHMSLGLLGGCLCLLSHYPKQSVDVWVLADYGRQSWTKLISIQQGKSTTSFEYIKPLAYSEDGTEVLMEQDNEKLCWYNLRKKTFRHATLQGLPESFEAVMCTSSLVPISSGTKKYPVIHEQPSKEIQSRRDKKRDDLDGFLTKGFKLKL